MGLGIISAPELLHLDDRGDEHAVEDILQGVTIGESDKDRGKPFILLLHAVDERLQRFRGGDRTFKAALELFKSIQ